MQTYPWAFIVGLLKRNWLRSNSARLLWQDTQQEINIRLASDQNHNSIAEYFVFVVNESLHQHEDFRANKKLHYELDTAMDIFSTFAHPIADCIIPYVIICYLHLDITTWNIDITYIRHHTYTVYEKSTNRLFVQTYDCSVSPLADFLRRICSAIVIVTRSVLPIIHTTTGFFKLDFIFGMNAGGCLFLPMMLEEYQELITVTYYYSHFIQYFTL